jgi:hypothetical protein
MPYTAWCSIKSVANCHSKTMIKFTSFFEKRASKKQTMNYDCGSASGGIIKTSSKVEEKAKKKKTSPKTTVKVTKAKEPKEPKSKVTKTKEPKEPKPKVSKTKPTIEVVDEVQEKPKIVRRKKVKLIIEE